MQYAKGALAVLVLLAIVVFSVQNREVIDVAFLSWSLSVPKVLIIVGTYVLGMITGAWMYDFLKYLLKPKPASAAQ